MFSTDINIRTDSELKTKAQSILTDLELDMSITINVYLTQIVCKQAMMLWITKPKNKCVKIRGWEGRIYMSKDIKRTHKRV